jgi:hypothetical protein
MEKQMNLKRAFLIMTAALLLPGMVLAQVGDARFIVSKNFTDDNPTSIEVTITCNTGVPLTQSASITEDEGVGFVVTSFDPVQGTCEITEDGEAGYTGTYLANDSLPSTTSCLFEDNFLEGDQICIINNEPTPVPVVVIKEWNMEGAGGNEVDMDSVFYVTSEGSISGGAPCMSSPADGHINCAMLSFSGEGSQTVLVTPEVGGTVVDINEDNQDSAVVVTNDCGGSVTVSPGDAAESCTFTNTVFFEGIPTLNQYGMAILALLMLGVGFVGFRRFA